MVDARSAVGSIDRRIYGHFLEHVGRMVRGGIVGEPNSRAETFGRGLRQDVLHALKDLHVSVLRYPGGCFADVYRWREGVGENRPVTKNRFWGRLGKAYGPVEDNRFGTDEYLYYCDQIGALPYLCVNAGTAGPEEAADWISYVKRRCGTARGGTPTLCGIGNEQYGFWEVGHCGPRTYGEKYRAYREALKAVDPSVETVAVGCDDSYAPRWNLRLLEQVGNEVDYLSIHTYLPFDAKPWRLLTKLRKTTNVYYALVSAGRTFERKIDWIDAGCRNVLGRSVPLAYDEWNFLFAFRQLVRPVSNLAFALGAAAILHAFHRRSQIVRVANLSALINVVAPPIYTDRDRLLRSSMFHVMRLYAELAGSRRLAAEVDCPTFSSRRLGGIEAVGTAPILDVSATFDDERGHLALFIIHKHHADSCEAVVQVRGTESASEAHIRTLCASSPFEENTFGDERRVRVEERSEAWRGGELRLVLPPHSLTAVTVASRRLMNRR